MSDLISRSALIKKFKILAEYEYDNKRREVFKQCLDYIMNAKEISFEYNEKSRLLDAKEIIRIAESEFDENDMFKIRWLIAHTPTAYDIEKVVEVLEERAEKHGKLAFSMDSKNFCNIADKLYGKQVECLEIIDIVKRGGVE